jgi:hypothetical protein
MRGDGGVSPRRRHRSRSFWYVKRRGLSRKGLGLRPSARSLGNRIDFIGGHRSDAILLRFLTNDPEDFGKFDDVTDGDFLLPFEWRPPQALKTLYFHPYPLPVCRPRVAAAAAFCAVMSA